METIKTYSLCMCLVRDKFLSNLHSHLNYLSFEVIAVSQERRTSHFFSSIDNRSNPFDLSDFYKKRHLRKVKNSKWIFLQHVFHQTASIMSTPEVVVASISRYSNRKLCLAWRNSVLWRCRLPVFTSQTVSPRVHTLHSVSFLGIQYDS